MQIKTKCPLWKKPTEKVCPTCVWYVAVRGKDPQTGQELDEYRCAMAWLPKLLIENTKEQRFTTASADKVATEVGKVVQVVAAFGHATAAHLAHVEEQKQLKNGSKKISN